MMGSIISAIHDDINEYVALCEHFGEKIQYSPDHYGRQLEDCYGAHATELKERQRVEASAKAAQRREQFKRRLVPKRNNQLPAKYAVTVTFMHGDADAHTTETFRAGTEDEAINLYDAFGIISDAQGYDMTPKELRNELLRRECLEPVIALVEDIPRDVIYDGSGQLASISKIQVFMDGIEMEIRGE